MKTQDVVNQALNPYVAYEKAQSAHLRQTLICDTIKLKQTAVTRSNGIKTKRNAISVPTDPINLSLYPSTPPVFPKNNWRWQDW